MQALVWAVSASSFWQTGRISEGGKYYKKYHKIFYAGQPLYNTYYFFSIRQASPIFSLKIDFGV